MAHGESEGRVAHAVRQLGRQHGEPAAAVSRQAERREDRLLVARRRPKV